ncbi:MAG: twin-arginine translocase subunit TatC [Treponema sp.]|nr:twin-arginine translocase subunit TatC [Treponema sp.]
MAANDKEMPILGHIRELRNIILTSAFALAIACLVSYFFANQIIEIFTKPFMGIDSLVDKSLVVSSVAEGFVAQLRITVIAGMIISMPVHIFGIVRFIFPGLTTREKRIVLSFLICSLILIVVGAYFVYFWLIPLAINFLTRPYFVPESVGFLLNYESNVFYILTFIFWAVVALQAPLIMEILMVLKILKRRQVWKATRFIIVAIFILAAIVTPPDIASQIGVATPLIVFYFLAILVAKIFKFGED